MTTRFSSMADTLKSRWRSEWSQDPSFVPLAQALNRSLDAVTAVSAEAAIIRSSDKLTAQGQMDEVRAVAKAKAASTLRNAITVLDAARAEIKTKRASLTLPKPEPSDVSGQMARAEMRAWMRSLPSAQVLAHVMDERSDPRLLDALMEMPAPMSGVTDDMRGHVESHFVSRVHAAEVERLEQLGDAMDLANAAVGTARYELQRETGFGHDQRGFDKWINEATAV